jgi:hypothetical protein
LRFRSSASASLSRTLSVAGNRRTLTVSAWIKWRAVDTGAGTDPIFSVGPNNSTRQAQIAFLGSTYSSSPGTFLSINQFNGSTQDWQIITTQVFRDPSAWYHIVFAIDTSQATASNRVKLYVNGVQVTTFSSASYPSQNSDTDFGSTSYTQYIGRDGYANVSNRYYDGYMAEYNYIDGQALTPSSFGAYDNNGVWQPIKYGGTYGTNGFYLPFTNNASSTTIGYDFSGNSNNWTANNIDVTSNNYRSFTTVGTYGWTAPAGVTSVTYLVVGGGGGGGSASATGTGGGGGAGGFLTGTATVTSGTTYTITVGAGGAASSNGGNSSISGTGLTTITAIGGGAGGVWNTAPGQNGGSGGGGAAGGGGGANLSAGTGTSGQGNAGGAGSTSNAPAGGGGGAGAVGGTGTISAAGNGGVGLQSSITGSAVYYAGGGGGAAAGATAGSGGLGGGGGAGVAGTANTGGGGGGASPSATGSAGGSGVVILSYTGAIQTGTTYDSMIDSPTVSNVASNYCVLNPVYSTSGVLSNANLKSSFPGGTTNTGVTSSFVVSSGKWYWEMVITGALNLDDAAIGVCSPATFTFSTNPNTCASSGYLRPAATSTQRTSVNGTNGATLTSATYASGQVLMVAFDADAKQLWFGAQGTWFSNGGVGNPAAGTFASITGINGTSWMPTMAAIGGTFASQTQEVNFGQRPFSYTPPTGFNALNTANLPPATIPNGALYMAATTYTGNGGTQTISNGGNTTTNVVFQPDFVWMKSRNNTYGHNLFDSVRGGSKRLVSNLTDAELSVTGGVNSFNSNGMTIQNDATYSNINASATTYIGWQWNAGSGATSTNTNGSITSLVGVNPTAGFSIVSYTGTGAVATVGHGLNVAPNLIIWKNRSATENWVVYHSSLGAAGNVYLNLTNGYSADSTTQNNTAPTSSVFTVATSGAVNGSTRNIIAYCWSAVAGYSAFGSYTGNGSTDGPFVYCGFRPRFLLVKATSGTENWNLFDTSRSQYNVANNLLLPNATTAETSDTYLDFLSNGVKFRNSSAPSGAGFNTNGVTYVYAAFAENPFNNSRAR